GARAQVVGVSAPELVRTIAEVLAQLGATRAFVVHGAGGIDELSPAGPNFVCEVVNGEVRARNIDPLEFGLPRCDPSDLRGGSPAENAAAIRAGLAGENGGRRSAILVNGARTRSPPSSPPDSRPPVRRRCRSSWTSASAAPSTICAPRARRRQRRYWPRASSARSPSWRS